MKSLETASIPTLMLPGAVRPMLKPYLSKYHEALFQEHQLLLTAMKKQIQCLIPLCCGRTLGRTDSLCICLVSRSQVTSLSTGGAHHPMPLKLTSFPASSTMMVGPLFDALVVRSPVDVEGVAPEEGVGWVVVTSSACSEQR